MTTPNMPSRTVEVECSSCEYNNNYTPTKDGRVPDPCPECGAELLKA